MSKGLLFWIVFIIAVIATVFLNWPFDRRSGAWLIVLALIALLGWAVFGGMVH